jgi:hypothetical protein
VSALPSSDHLDARSRPESGPDSARECVRELVSAGHMSTLQVRTWLLGRRQPRRAGLRNLPCSSRNQNALCSRAGAVGRSAGARCRPSALTAEPFPPNGLLASLEKRAIGPARRDSIARREGSAYPIRGTRSGPSAYGQFSRDRLRAPTRQKSGHAPEQDRAAGAFRLPGRSKARNALCTTTARKLAAPCPRERWPVTNRNGGRGSSSKLVRLTEVSTVFELGSITARVFESSLQMNTRSSA